MPMNFPTENISQEIGRVACKVYEYISPVKWIGTPLAGDSDFGIDYQIQLKTDSQEVKYSFKLQLKGTTQNMHTACGKFISHNFKVETLNLYKNEESLVAIVLVDFSKYGLEEFEKNTAYFYFLEDEWFKNNADKLEKNKYITIKIPVGNIFDKSLDINDYYQERIDKSQTFNKLGETICRHSSSGLEAVNKISRSIDTKPYIVDALMNQSDAPWIDNPEGSIASKLKEIDTFLNTGKVIDATNKLVELDEYLADMAKGESAEYYLLQGRIHDRSGETDKAILIYKKSLSLSDAPRYLVPYIEAHFKLPSPSKSKIKLLSKQLSNEDPMQCVLKAKCLVYAGDINEGLLLFDEHHPEKFVSKMLLLMIADESEKLDDLFKSFNVKNLTDERSKFLYFGINARRLAEKVIGRSLHGDTKGFPLTGEVGYDRPLMAKAKESCDLAWKSAKILGYPSDTSVLFDISMIVYGFYNQHESLSRHFKEMNSQSPSNIYIIECYSILLFNNGRHQENYEVLKQVDELRVGEAILFAISCFYLKKHNDMLNVVRLFEDEIIESNCDLAATVICLAEGVAGELFEVEDEERYGNILSNLESGEHLCQIRNFIKLANQDKDNIQNHANDLYSYYEKNGKPFVIAFQLFPNFDPDTTASADKIIALGEDILVNRELTESEYFHFCNALIAKKDWDFIEKVADRQLLVRLVSNQWNFLKAMAHHHRGEIGKSYESLEKLFNSSDDITTNNVLFYTDICLKLGFLDKAENIIRQQVIKTKDRSKKKNLLHALIHIYTYNGPDSSPKYAKVVKEYGKYVDQNDEQEESSFLTVNIITTDKSFDKSYNKTIQKRFDMFFQRFPDSNYLRKGNLSENDSPDEMIDKLNKMVGNNKATDSLLEKNKLSIINGTLPMPLCFLHKCIRDTNDVYHSWELSKATGNSLLEYKILHAPQSGDYQFSELCKRKKVLLEETTLLTLYELNVLSMFLNNINDFYLLQSVFDDLTSAAHNIGGSICSKTAKGILSQIQPHVVKLKCIADNEGAFKSYASRKKSDGTLLLTDDMKLLHLENSTDEKCSHGNSIDCLQFLFELEAITKELFYGKVMQLSELGFTCINMKLTLLSDIVHYNYNLNKTDDIKELSCYCLLSNIFNLQNNHSALRVLTHFINKEHGCLSIKLIASIVKLILDNSPFLLSANCLGAIFIHLSLSYPVLPEETCFGASLRHVELWRFYNDLCYELGIKRSENEHFYNLISLIEPLPKELRDQCYVSVSGAFFENSNQMKLLAELVAKS
jgi:tetratricopeptide (TPR) repeat protein